jgi:hypothetical protein
MDRDYPPLELTSEQVVRGREFDKGEKTREGEQGIAEG